MKYIFLIIFLTGCAATPTTQVVKVPVPIVCSTPTPPKPDFCMQKLLKEDDLFVKTRCVLSDIIQHVAYEESLLTALESCR